MLSAKRQVPLARERGRLVREFNDGITRELILIKKGVPDTNIVTVGKSVELSVQA